MADAFIAAFLDADHEDLAPRDN